MIGLAYGTYGLGKVPLETAIPAIAAAGFEALELTLADGYPGVSRRVGASDGAAIARRVADAGLSLIAFLAKDTVLPGTDRAGVDDATLSDLIQSAHNCGGGDETVLTFTMGGMRAEWPARKAELAERLRQLGDIAAREGAVLAVEPHANGLIDSVDRAVWLMQALDHPAIRLNFDISHYALPGAAFDLEDAASRLLPYAVHAHIKDSVPTEQGFRFVLPGAGALDLAQYFAVLGRRGWSRPVTVEVSAMVFNAPGYDPIDAIGTSFSALDAARREGNSAGQRVRA